MRYQSGPNAQRGVTLLELMVVAVIIAILAAIAIPTYRQQVLRSNRSNAKAMLMQAAQVMERCFTTTGTFVGCGVFPVTSPEGLYVVTAETPTSTTYVLTATPQGGQVNDTACGNLTLNELDQRGASGTGDDDECWSR